MVSVTAARVQRYRSTSTGWIAALVVFIGLVFVILGIGGIVSPHNGDSAIRIVGVLAVAAGCLVIVWALRVVAQMGVTTNEQGIVVQNWVHRRFVKWDEIREFSFGSDLDDLSVRQMFSSPMLSTYVVLDNGRHVGLAGLSATRVNRSQSRAKVQDLLDQLDVQRRSFTNE